MTVCAVWPKSSSRCKQCLATQKRAGSATTTSPEVKQCRFTPEHSEPDIDVTYRIQHTYFDIVVVSIQVNDLYALMYYFIQMCTLIFNIVFCSV